MQSLTTILLPVAVLVLIGHTLRRTQRINAQQIGGITYVIMNVCLPSVLLLTFLGMELEWRFVWLSLTVMGMLTAFWIAGSLTRRLVPRLPRLLPFYTTGFSFGFLGIPLVTLVFGEAELALYTVMGVGHEGFVWFIYYPLLWRTAPDLTGVQGNPVLRIARSMGRSPVALAIVVGLLLNAAGAQQAITESGRLASVWYALNLLAQATTPLILIVVGYNVHVRRGSAGHAGLILTLRIGVTFALGYAIKHLFVEPILGFSGVILDHVWFMFLMLPGLYSLPIYISRTGTTEEEEEASTVVTAGTLVSMGLLAAYLVLERG